MRLGTLLVLLAVSLPLPAQATTLFFKTPQAEVSKGTIRNVAYFGPTASDRGNLYLEIGTYTGDGPYCTITGVSQAVGLHFAEQIKAGRITAVYCYVQNAAATFQETQMYWLQY